MAEPRDDQRTETEDPCCQNHWYQVFRFVKSADIDANIYVTFSIRFIAFLQYSHMPIKIIAYLLWIEPGMSDHDVTINRDRQNGEKTDSHEAVSQQWE